MSPFSLQINATGLDHLKGMTSLQELNLHRTQVTLATHVSRHSRVEEDIDPAETALERRC